MQNIEIVEGYPFQPLKMKFITKVSGAKRGETEESAHDSGSGSLHLSSIVSCRCTTPTSPAHQVPSAWTFSHQKPGHRSSRCGQPLCLCAPSFARPSPTTRKMRKWLRTTKLTRPASSRPHASGPNVTPGMTGARQRRHRAGTKQIRFYEQGCDVRM